MKCSRSLMIALLAALSLGLVGATVHAGHYIQSVAVPTARNPMDVAKEAVARWKLTLKVTDEQAPMFESVMINSYRQMGRAKASAAGDKAKTYESVLAVFREREVALAKVLTPEQMVIYRNHVHHGVSYAKKHLDHEASLSK